MTMAHNASEAVQKIATDQKKYCKCSAWVIYKIDEVYISINNSEKKVGYLDTSDVAKKTAEVAQKKEQ